MREPSGPKASSELRAAEIVVIDIENAYKKYDRGRDYLVFESSAGNDDVILVQGGLRIEGNLSDWYERERKRLGVEDSGLILIEGDLEVTNVEVETYLLVTGNLYCEHLSSYDFYTHIGGDAFIKYALVGYGNDGSIQIDGHTDVPFLFTSDHAIEIENLSEKTICFDLFSKNVRYEFDRTDLRALGFEDGICVESFVADLRTGKSPFPNISDSEMTLDFEKSAFLKK